MVELAIAKQFEVVLMIMGGLGGRKFLVLVNITKRYIQWVRIKNKTLDNSTKGAGRIDWDILSSSPIFQTMRL